MNYYKTKKIRANLEVGRIAIVHENNISVPGWTGAGYILFDQQTDAGSYKISGGSNGGWFTLLLVAVLSILSIVASTAALGLVAPIFIGYLVALSLGLALATIWLGVDFKTFEKEIKAIEAIVSSMVFTSLIFAAGVLGAVTLPIFIIWFVLTTTLYLSALI